VIALPATSGGRSFSGNVILDEMAYHMHPEKVWDGASATVLHGYRLRALSTPNGVGNFWHNLLTDPDQHAGYVMHQTTLDEARLDGMPVDEEECRKMSRGDPRVFDQLFRCKFLDNEQQYIPTELITACSLDEAFCFEGECYAGLDLGRASDRTELVIVRKDQFGVRWQQYAESCRRTSSDDVERLAALTFSRAWNCRRLVVDATGMGSFPAERLQKQYGRSRVEPLTFTQQSKEVLATGLYSAFTEQTVRLNKKDSVLIDDLCAIRRIVTAAGNVRYDAPQTSKGHGDRAWAFALALHGCAGPDRRRREVYRG
jgi:phage FluMu gp28-like protein